ncbi:MAG TPA: DMT family protein [Kofleriaceae bacterium]|jgi:uncharacterized protein (DUF486 family)|nr:DMT family protein [Kofleriaceae bacterium]
MRAWAVPLMLACSGAFMAVAWLGHLAFRSAPMWTALLVSWSIVLPEYILNVGATRWGFGTYSGVQMAGFHLVSGVICIALVSRLILNEPWSYRHAGGLVLVACGFVLLIGRK